MSNDQDRFSHVKDENARKLIEKHLDFFLSQGITFAANSKVRTVENYLNSKKYKKYIEGKNKEASVEGSSEKTPEKNLENSKIEDNQIIEDKSEKIPDTGNVVLIGEMSYEEAQEAEAKVKSGDLESESIKENGFWKKWAEDNNKRLEQLSEEDKPFLGKFYDKVSNEYETTIREGQNEETGRKTIDMSRNEKGELPPEVYFDGIVKRVINITEENNKALGKNASPLVLIRSEVSEEFKAKLIEACKRNGVKFKDFNPKKKEGEIKEFSIEQISEKNAEELIQPDNKNVDDNQEAKQETSQQRLHPQATVDR